MRGCRGLGAERGKNSALGRVVAAAGSAAVRRLWEQADSVVAVRLLYLEAAAALVRAKAMRRVDPPTRERALGQATAKV